MRCVVNWLLAAKEAGDKKKIELNYIDIICLHIITIKHITLLTYSSFYK